MESFYRMLDSQLVLFAYMGIGAYCRKTGIIDDAAKKKITELILRVALPCMVFNSFNKPLTPEILRQTAMAFGMASAIAVLSLLLGKFIYNMFPKEKKSVLQYCTLVNNSGFLGLPLVSSMYGEEGLLYASIFIIPNRIMMWTAGLSLFTESDFRAKCRNILLNPAIVAVYLGLARRIFNLPFPVFLDNAVSKVGATTSPLSMMLIGTMLVGADWKGMLEPSILYMAFVRLIALPLTALLGMRALGFGELLTGVSMILTGMPAGSTSVLLATQYGKDETFASRLVVSTTVMSLFTAPLLMMLV